MALALLPFAVSAQPSLQRSLHLPRTGDELVKEQVAFQSPGEPGQNRDWDFSGIRFEDETALQRYFTRGGQDILGAENGKLSFLRIAGDSLLTAGYETPSSLVRYHRPGLLLRFPIAFGDSSSSAFSGRGKYHDRFESVVRGHIQTRADACGRLILPGNDTLDNAVRVHIRTEEIALYSPISPGFDIDRPPTAGNPADSLQVPDTVWTDLYCWYGEGYRYPLFETVETTRIRDGKPLTLGKDTYLYHPAGQEQLPEDAPNRTVRERRLAEKEARMLESAGNILWFQCAPNPVRDRLEIGIILRKPSPVQVSLFDLKGRLILRLPGKQPGASYFETVNMSRFPQGTYLLEVRSG